MKLLTPKWSWPLPGHPEAVKMERPSLFSHQLRQTSADDRHLSGTKKAWDCGCHRHLEAGSDEALVAKVIYHLAVQHPEAHATLEQADELVGTEAYDEPS
jgi:hypothetical protein